MSSELDKNQTPDQRQDIICPQGTEDRTSGVTTTATASGTSVATNNDCMKMDLSGLHISMMTDFYAKEPMQASLMDIAAMAANPVLKQKTERIRALRGISADESRPLAERTKAEKDADKLKRSTPVLFPAVQLKDGKTRKCIQGFNPLIAFDIDHIDAERVKELMCILGRDSHTAFAHPSSSFHGIHGAICVDCGEFLNQHWDGSHTEAYRFVWEQVRLYVEKLLDEKIDESCKNPEHSFALCGDDLAYFNYQPEPLHIETSGFEDNQSRKPKTGKLPFSTKKVQHAELSDVEQNIIKELERQGCKFDQGRNNYVFRFAAICNSYGVYADDVFAYCIAHFEAPDFDGAEILATVTSAYKNEAEHGTRSTRVRYAKPDEMVAYIEDYGEWRYNELSLAYEVKRKEAAEFQACCDEDYNEISRLALMDSLLFSVNQVTTLVHSMRTPRFNPVLAYRDSLPQCAILPDGMCQIEGRTEERDYISEVADRLHTESPNEEVREYFKKWIVQMVKSWICPNEVNQIVFGLLGEQGIYKTTFFEKILPPELQREYFDVKESNGVFTKDEMMKLANLLLYEQEEIESMDPKELNQFKSLVSMKRINVRPPYGRHSIHRPRLCSFSFTGNSREILSDSTGSRRFVPFWVNSIDSPFENPIDYDAFYAQAFKLAEPDSGFVSYIPTNETRILNERNQDFSISIMEHELVDRYLSKPTDSNPGIKATGGIITAHLQRFAGKAILDTRKITAYLRSEGYPEGRDKHNKYFLVVSEAGDIM